MTAKRIHYPRTTGQQRKRLFELWEETGNISEACRKAHVGRGTFYYWKPRFEKEGYDGLAEFENHAPDEPSRIAPELEQAVIEMKQAHPDWGKKRIVHELAKSNNWVPVVSPNTVKRILTDKTWPDDQELAALLRQFLDEFNNRPHQGLPIPGLSLNEFANRIWLM